MTSIRAVIPRSNGLSRWVRSRSRSSSATHSARKICTGPLAICWTPRELRTPGVAISRERSSHSATNSPRRRRRAPPASRIDSVYISIRETQNSKKRLTRCNLTSWQRRDASADRFERLPGYQAKLWPPQRVPINKTPARGAGVLINGIVNRYTVLLRLVKPIPAIPRPSRNSVPGSGTGTVGGSGGTSSNVKAL